MTNLYNIFGMLNQASRAQQMCCLYNRPTSLAQMIMHLQLFLKDEFYEFQVQREHVLEDLLQETRKSRFYPLKPITVSHKVLLCTMSGRHMTELVSVV